MGPEPCPGAGRSQHSGEGLPLPQSCRAPVGDSHATAGLGSLGGVDRCFIIPRGVGWSNLPSGSTQAPSARPGMFKAPWGLFPGPCVHEAVLWGITELVEGLVPSGMKGQQCHLGRPCVLWGSGDWPGRAWGPGWHWGRVSSGEMLCGQEVHRLSLTRWPLPTLEEVPHDVWSGPDAPPCPLCTCGCRDGWSPCRAAPTFPASSAPRPPPRQAPPLGPACSACHHCSPLTLGAEAGPGLQVAGWGVLPAFLTWL